MKSNGFRTLAGGKKMFVVSIITALIAASLSAFSVFAAPSTTSASARIFGNQLSELNADRAFLNNFKANHNNFANASDPLKLQRYIARYDFALIQADAVVKGRGTVLITSKSTNAQVNTIDNMDQTAQQNLAIWLHEMRDLRVKMEQVG